MNTLTDTVSAGRFMAYGEMLWDCLPGGERHAGGAAFNVCAHLAHLGGEALLVSAAGQDALGDELVALAEAKGINTRFVSRTGACLPTGTVQVTLDGQRNATYVIVEPVAWDEITATDAARHAAASCAALVYGSLATRSPYNLRQLELLLDVPGPTKFFDVNLRPPFDNPQRVLTLAKRADVVKMNDDEIARLALWLRTGTASAEAPPMGEEGIAACCAVLAQAAGLRRVCVTRGARGAAFWDAGTLTCAEAPAVAVRDTIGAGDAFMAALMLGLSRGLDTAQVLPLACRLGAYVASQVGASPPLPASLVEAFGESNRPKQSILEN